MSKFMNNCPDRSQLLGLNPNHVCPNKTDFSQPILLDMLSKVPVVKFLILKSPYHILNVQVSSLFLQI